MDLFEDRWLTGESVYRTDLERCTPADRLSTESELRKWRTVDYATERLSGTMLMAGALLALAGCLSALTRNQVIAFVVGTAASFLFMMSGLDLVLSLFTGWAPPYVIDMISALSFLTHFQTISQGLLHLPALVFFTSMISVCLFINIQIVELKKAG